ncbi:hypothetical protein XENORESO_004719 [Xenotaenia resolanae]|uniref:Uncharacterized protein n=1 Tax=Xenotaenia resolanae TaxID=208358 RepID=A0ABV0WD61_9TELE
MKKQELYRQLRGSDVARNNSEKKTFFSYQKWSSAHAVCLLCVCVSGCMIWLPCPFSPTHERLCVNFVYLLVRVLSSTEAEELYQRRVLTITGICVALLVVGIVCVVAYCKTKYVFEGEINDLSLFVKD